MSGGGSLWQVPHRVWTSSSVATGPDCALGWVDPRAATDGTSVDTVCVEPRRVEPNTADANTSTHDGPGEHLTPRVYAAGC